MFITRTQVAAAHRARRLGYVRSLSSSVPKVQTRTQERVTPHPSAAGTSSPNEMSAQLSAFEAEAARELEEGKLTERINELQSQFSAMRLRLQMMRKLKAEAEAEKKQSGETLDKTTSAVDGQASASVESLRSDSDSPSETTRPGPPKSGFRVVGMKPKPVKEVHSSVEKLSEKPEPIGEVEDGESKLSEATGRKGLEDDVNDNELMEAFNTVVSEAETEAKANVKMFEFAESGSLRPAELIVKPVESPRPDAKVARLSHRLNRVLFSPGVHYLRDPRTGVWNFSRDLGHIVTPEEFAFHRLPQYITASEDDELMKMAEAPELKFVGSTSTLTASLSQLYFTLSGDKGVDVSQLSSAFASKRNDFTFGAQLPASLVVRYLPNGRYAIDNNKEHAIDENVLSDYGRILEKLLTAEQKDFKRFLTSSPEDGVSEEERKEREAYCYSRGSSLLMRSQLDCQDDRLPGNGTFDIKTRASFPIRRDRANYLANSAYEITELYGDTGSYEREFYDLTRSGMLKYCFQAHIGQMDGIFVAYHNTVSCAGFQYLPLSEIDTRLFGSTEMAQQVFQATVALMERILIMATSMYPKQSINLTLHRKKRKNAGSPKELIAVVQPTEWDKSSVRPARTISLEIENELDSVKHEDPVFSFSSDPEVRKDHQWVLNYKMSVTPEDMEGYHISHRNLDQQVALLRAVNALYVPEGSTPSDMARITAIKRRRAAQAAKAKAEAAATDVDVNADEDGASKSQTDVEVEGQAETHSESGEPASTTPSPPSPSPSRSSHATIRWMSPNDTIMELRNEAKAIGKAVAERRKLWRDDVQHTMFWMDEEKSALATSFANREIERTKRREKIVAARQARKKGKKGDKAVWRTGQAPSGPRKSWEERAKASKVQSAGRDSSADP